MLWLAGRVVADNLRCWYDLRPWIRQQHGCHRKRSRVKTLFLSRHPSRTVGMKSDWRRPGWEVRV